MTIIATNNDKQKALRVQNQIINILSKRFTRKFTRLFKKFSKKASSQFILSQTITEALLNDHQKQIQKELMTLYRTAHIPIVALNRNALKKSFEIDYSKKNDEETSSILSKWIQTTSLKKAKSIKDVSKDKVKAIIDNSIAEGLSTEETARLINESLGGSLSRSRALLISITETHSAVVFADQESTRINAEDLNVKIKKIWIPVQDERTRIEHASMAGKSPIPINSNFSVGGESLNHPGDPNGSAGNVINCRCVLGFVRG